MNNLSWLLYFAGLAHNYDTLVCFFIVAYMFTMIAVVLSTLGSDKFTKKLLKKIRGVRFFTITVICLLVVDVIKPNRDTLYAIAASEFGEDALKSNISTKAQKAIEKWIDSQLEDKK